MIDYVLVGSGLNVFATQLSRRKIHNAARCEICGGAQLAIKMTEHARYLSAEEVIACDFLYSMRTFRVCSSAYCRARATTLCAQPAPTFNVVLAKALDKIEITGKVAF